MNLTFLMKGLIVKMKKRLPSRILSMAAAAALGCSAVIGTGSEARAEAETTESSLSAPVPVIIKLNGEAVLGGQGAAELGTDYLDTPEAASQTAELQRISAEAEEYIRSIYPELNIGYRYDLLMNGFSCELPEELFDDVRSCPLVDSISHTVTTTYVRPQMYYAPELGGSAFFSEETGYYGEGEVVAVIDNEFDITHDMFAPIDDKDVTLTKEDIADIASTIGFNVTIDPEQAYVSSKLPFVVDYADDTPYDLTDEEHYHGTHVAGIAGGNEVTSGDQNISGVARDAQLVLMKVFNTIILNEATGETYNLVGNDVLLAALEDAAKLKADVINLSLGSPEPNIDSLPYKDTMTALNNAGILVVAAAGNDANNRLQKGVVLDVSVDNVDTNTIGEPSVLPEVLSVAAANNSFLRETGFVIDGFDEVFGYLDSYSVLLEDCLGEGAFEYVYCGGGQPEDYEGKDVSGKIVLVDRDGKPFSNKAKAAAEAGAKCMIVADNTDSQELLAMNLGDAKLPSAAVTKETGELMKEAENKVLHFEAGKKVVRPLDSGIAGFSSFGPSEDLRIKPEIAGIGNTVSSAGYNNTIRPIDGTSMASPYVAGCAAIYDQFLKRKGIDFSGADKTRFMKNMLMNSAVLLEVEDHYESPRRQGAGLVNLRNLLNERVMITGPTGEAKVELMDKLTNTFSFEVNIDNFSDQDVEFTEARLVLDTDQAGYVETLDGSTPQLTICGTRLLSCTADLTSLMKTKAGEKRTETITVELPDGEGSELEVMMENFKNGFFIEGYVVLSGAENCCDISIPVLGFCGDWAKVPIFSQGDDNFAPPRYYAETGKVSLYSDVSIAGFTEAVYQLLDRLSEDQREKLMNDPSFLDQYADMDLLNQMEKFSSDAVYISPDNDGFNDRFGAIVSLLRSCNVLTIDLCDKSGEVLSKNSGAWFPSHETCYIQTDEDLSFVEDGEYTGAVRAYVRYPGAEQDPQTLTFPVVVDTVKPELEVMPVIENGRKYIEITSSDENLDGIYIMGSGTGGEAEDYYPNREPLEEASAFTVSLSNLRALYNENNAIISNDTVFASYLMGTDDQFISGKLASYNFSDILPAYRYSDENGVVRVRYDITELKDYTVSAVDKAFNITEMKASDTVVPLFRQGIWWVKKSGDDDRYYNISEDEYCGSVLYQNGDKPEDFIIYTDDDIVEIMTYSNEKKLSKGIVRWIDRSTAEVTWEDGTVEVLYHITPGGSGAWNFYSTRDMKIAAEGFYASKSGNSDVTAEVSYNEDSTADITVRDQDGEVVEIYTGVSRNDLTARDSAGNEVRLEYIAPGLYKADLDPTGNAPDFMYAVLTDDMNVKAFSVKDGAEYSCAVGLSDGIITFTDGTGAEIKGEFKRVSSDSVAVVIGDKCVLAEHLSWDVPEDLRIYTLDQLKEMALDYGEGVRGERSEIVSAEYDETERYLIRLSDGQGFSVDPMGAEGYDQGGNYVYLAKKPEITDYFTPGRWMKDSADKNVYYFFDGEGNIDVLDVRTGNRTKMSYEWIGSAALILTSDDGCKKGLLAPYSEHQISIVWDDDTTDMFDFISEESVEDFTFYTDNELAEMVSKDYENKTGEKVTGVEVVPDEYGGDVYVILDGENVYAVNRYTGIGADCNGEEVDLPQTGNNDMTSAGAAAVAGVLILAGAAAAAGSGVLRRRKGRE